MIIAVSRHLTVSMSPAAWEKSANTHGSAWDTWPFEPFMTPPCTRFQTKPLHPNCKTQVKPAGQHGQLRHPTPIYGTLPVTGFMAEPVRMTRRLYRDTTGVRSHSPDPMIGHYPKTAPARRSAQEKPHHTPGKMVIAEQRVIPIPGHHVIRTGHGAWSKMTKALYPSMAPGTAQDRDSMQ